MLTNLAVGLDLFYSEPTHLQSAWYRLATPFHLSPPLSPKKKRLQPRFPGPQNSRLTVRTRAGPPFQTQTVGRFGKTRPTGSERSCSVSLNRITPYRGEGKDGLPEQINGFCQAELQAANESGG